MKWFTGGIPQAIKVAKDRGTLFVVYIYGSDEMSLEMNQSWENDEVTVALSDVVAIRIDGSSEDSKHFSQIYPIVVIPATYCIGENGVPLEVIGGALKPEELITRIKKVQEMHAAQKLSLSGGATNSSSTRQVTSAKQDTVQGESPGPSAMQEEQGAAGDPSTSAPLEEKLAKAKELIERKRIEKEQQEFEKAREEEIKRRKLGQDLQKLKSTQQEIQMKELKDQMKKEKDDEKKARERVKQQIAKDREDRAKKFDAEKQEREKQLEDKKKEKLLQQQAEAAAEEARKSETARIQVRLPDGSSLTHTFPSTDTFRCLYSLVAERLKGNVSLSQTFPRRRFEEEDMDRTFMELQLAPSAVLIALPASQSSYQASSSSSSSLSLPGILSMLMYPLIMLWKFIFSMFGGGSSRSTPGGATGGSARGSVSSSSSQQQTPRSDRPTTARQRGGNMGRMTDLRDDEDDMNTYNGNSTQQM